MEKNYDELIKLLIKKNGLQSDHCIACMGKKYRYCYCLDHYQQYHNIHINARLKDIINKILNLNEDQKKNLCNKLSDLEKLYFFKKNEIISDDNNINDHFLVENAYKKFRKNNYPLFIQNIINLISVDKSQRINNLSHINKNIYENIDLIGNYVLNNSTIDVQISKEITENLKNNINSHLFKKQIQDDINKANLAKELSHIANDIRLIINLITNNINNEPYNMNGLLLSLYNFVPNNNVIFKYLQNNINIIDIQYEKIFDLNLYQSNLRYDIYGLIRDKYSVL
jgi:hypothetical protein